MNFKQKKIQFHNQIPDITRKKHIKSLYVENNVVS